MCRDRMGVVTVHSLQLQILLHFVTGKILTWSGIISAKWEDISMSAIYMLHLSQRKRNPMEWHEMTIKHNRSYSLLFLQIAAHWW